MSNLYHTVTLSRGNVIVRTSGGRGSFFCRASMDLCMEKHPPCVFGSPIKWGGVYG